MLFNLWYIHSTDISRIAAQCFLQNRASIASGRLLWNPISLFYTAKSCVLNTELNIIREAQANEETLWTVSEMCPKITIIITRESEVIMFSPCVFVSLFVCLFVCVYVWLSVYVCHDVCPGDLTKKDWCHTGDLVSVTLVGSNPAFSRGRQLVSFRFEYRLPVPEHRN